MVNERDAIVKYLLRRAGSRPNEDQLAGMKESLPGLNEAAFVLYEASMKAAAEQIEQGVHLLEYEESVN